MELNNLNAQNCIASNPAYLFLALFRISLFDADYKFVRHILTEEDGLLMPSFVRVTTTGQLIVCEWKRNKVKVYDFESSV